MNILVIGGTEFVGRHIVECALSRGHRVSVFHRGQHGKDLFPEAEHILGDRDGGLAILENRKWDWVIDTCGYVPRIVRQSVEAAQPAAGRYLFISTISVYATFAQAAQNETAPLAGLDDPTTETVDAQTYGGLKVLCEQEVQAGFGENSLIVRPGMIVGPYDKTDRFTYWFRRAAKGGKMVSLCERDEPVQFIDGRDLAAFCIHLIEANANGTYNATGPQFPMTWGDIFDEAALTSGVEYEIVRPPLDWLTDRKIETGKAFPSQFPAEKPEYAGVYQVDVRRAVDAGLRFLPLSETVRATLEWRSSIEDTLKVGLTEDEETKLLQEMGEA